MTQDFWILLDLRGLILHSYHSGTDVEALEDGVKTPGHTLDNFVERYLLRCIELTPLNRIIAVQDSGSDYRKRLYPEYKAGRAEPEPKVKLAHETSRLAIRELLHALGIPQVSVAGTEADDIIAFLAAKLPGMKIIHTVDQDLIALASDQVKVFLKGSPCTSMGEVLPRHVCLYKSIVGDPSDNIKGVKGLGAAAWSKLASDYGLDGLDELDIIVRNGSFAELRNIAQTNNCKLLTRLFEQAQEWSLSYNLASLHPELVEARYGREFRRLRWEKRLPSRDRLNRLLEQTGCRHLDSQLGPLMPAQYLIQASDWDDTTLAEAKALFEQSRFISLDWETSAPEHKPFLAASDGEYVDMLSSQIVGSGITCGPNHEHTFYFNWGHADVENRIPINNLLLLLDQIPEGMPIIAQNAVFELTVLKHSLSYVLNNLHDTKLMHSHIDEASPSGLKDLSKRYLNYDQIHYRDIIEKGKTMADYPAEYVFKYGADDPLVTAHLYDLFYIILCIEQTWEFVRDYEFPPVYLFADAYIAGVSVDYDEVRRQHDEDQTTYDASIARIREILSQNSEPDGYRIILDELYSVFDAETRRMQEHLASSQAVDSRHPLWKWLKNATPGVYEYDEALQDARNHKRLLLDKETRQACRYEPYQETMQKPNFQFRLTAINTMAESKGWPLLADWTVEVIDAYWANAAGDQDRESFAKTIHQTWHMPASKRSKSPPYLRLKSWYGDWVPAKLIKSGTELNLDSPPQMQRLLYGTLGLPITLRVLDVSDSRKALGLSDGGPQANEDAIKMAIAMCHAEGWKREVLDLLLKAKKAITRIKFFYKKFPMWEHPIDGNIHPQFNQTGTETRRPSGSSPNMLQLSKKGDGVKVRRCILPNQKLGHDIIVSIDWDGEELRVLAGLSGDQKLTACYVGDNKLDPHSITAAQILGVSYDGFVSIRKDEEHPDHKRYDDVRKDAKNVNFGSSYGIGAHKLARKLLCHPDKAKQYLEAKKAAYWGIEEWRGRVIDFLLANGYVQTLFGSRKHVFNKLVTSDDGLLSYYQRASVNFQIQGVCADYLKYVLTHLLQSKILERTGAVMIAPIYDELVFSCHHSQAVPLITTVMDIMTIGIPGLPIPMLANPSVGKNFGDQVEVLKDCYDPLTPEKIEKAITLAFGETV